ncbi:hypothetical protein QQF64_019469, partial [Cirrhinus molitorella]
ISGKDEVTVLVSVSVMEGDSVTLHPDIKINQTDDIEWYFNKTKISNLTGNEYVICTDDECKKRFGDRLELNNGSLTIKNIRITDSGDYVLNIFIRDSTTIFNVSVYGVSAPDPDEVKESVTLDSGILRNPDDVMTWNFTDILIAEINGDQSKICTDEQCDERFKDRLKLNQFTGSLTIKDPRTSDSGLYKLHINVNNSKFGITRVKRFKVAVT